MQKLVFLKISYPGLKVGKNVKRIPCMIGYIDYAPVVVGHRLEIIIDHQLESVAAVDVIF